MTSASDLPAILGGTPAFPHGPPDWPILDDDVAASLQEALKDGSWGKYDGGHVEKLEAALAAYHQAPHVLTCASGTLAVEVALRALQVGPDDEVIMAAYEYEPNFLTVHALGARPVLVDVRSRHWNLDVGQLESACSAATKAIIATHLHGGLVDMRAVTEFAARHGLRVVEDAAQATGALVQGRRAGAWGDIGVVSFGGSKLMSAGRGGALLTQHADLQQRLRLALRRGIQQWAAMSELQAAALLPQLIKLDERNRRRKAALERLGELLRPIPGLALFVNDVDGTPSYYKVGFQFDAGVFGLSRERFVSAMRAEGIALDAGFRALHVGRAATRFRAIGALPQASRAHVGAVLLHHPVLLCNESNLLLVAEAVQKVYSNAQRIAALP